MADRHKTPRLYNSGAKKRKLAAERDKKTEEFISKVPKLESFFSKAISMPDETSGTEINLQKHQKDLNSQLNNSSEIETTEQHESDPSTSLSTPLDSQLDDHQLQSTQFLRDRTNGFKNDIGHWPEQSTEEMINYWAKKSSSDLQNCDEKLFEMTSVQKLQIQGTMSYVRKCSASLFVKKIEIMKQSIASGCVFLPLRGKFTVTYAS